jgi:hypothetical protein
MVPSAHSATGDRGLAPVAAPPAEKRALFADLVDGVPLPALGRLDLDSLARAAAPGLRR